MTTSLLHPAPVTVASSDDLDLHPRRAARDAWLRGRVAAVLDGEGLRLLVPMPEPTPGAVDLALRLYAVGSVALLDRVA